MKTLTKQQRIEGYKFALDNLGVWPFICTWLKYYLLSINDFNTSVFEAFPEFVEYHPDNRRLVEGWWPRDDKLTRIKVLTEIIDKLEKE